MFIPRVMLALVWAVAAASPSEAAGAICEAEMTRAARAHNVPIQVLYAVGVTETGHRGNMQPYAMNVDGRAVNSASLPEALKKFDQVRAGGAKFIDIGCMQVNHHYHAHKFGGLAQMFDPARNVSYAAQFLRDLRGREGNWTKAVARYNAGPNNDPAQRKYVCAVIRSMIMTGMGAWTPAARKLCG